MALDKLGLKETKEGLALVYSIINAAGKTLEDGKVGLRDLPHWFPVSTKIGPAVDNFKEIWPELKDLDKAEAEELILWTQKELNIPQDQVEKWLELAVGTLIRLVEMYSMHLAARQTVKRAEQAAEIAKSAPRALVASVEKSVNAATKEITETVVEPAKEAVKEAQESLISKAKKKVTKSKSTKKAG